MFRILPSCLLCFFLIVGCSAPREINKEADLSPEVMECIEEGSKVGAVKTYQKEHGLELAVAKKELEAICKAKGIELGTPKTKTE